MGWFKNTIRKWLGIIPAQERHFTIKETFTHDDYVLMNRIWYRGDPSELSQFYKNLGRWGTNDSRFWFVTPPNGKTIRKIHSSMPSLIINKITDITVDDSLGVELTLADETNKEGHTQEEYDLWEEIKKDNKFKKLLKDATRDTLVDGDGSFKISIDTEISKYPLIEFFSGERVDYEYKRGRLFEVIFKTTYYGEEQEIYTLIERYGKGYVKYELQDNLGKEASLDTLDETKDLKDVSFSGDFIMAVPLVFFESSKYQNRGQSLIDGKYDDLDALDEILSQWIDAIRLGRATKLIPEELIPRDENNNRLPYNPITNQYVTYKNKSMNEDEESKPEVLQPLIESERFLQSYIQFMDLCLMGLISPSTLGMDIKKLDNGEAQREKEKVTMFTRNNLISALEDVIPAVVDVAMKTYDTMKSKQPGEYIATIEFGEYNNPSFEAVVETIGKARMNQIMSFEECVEQLYGDAKTDEEKEKEVKRLKEQFGNGSVDANFPGMDPGTDFFDDEEEEEEKKKKDQKEKEDGEEDDK